MKIINFNLGSISVGKIPLKKGRIVVICTDDDVVLIERVCSNNIKSLENIRDNSIGCESLVFLNFSINSFMQVMDDFIGRVCDETAL